MDDTLLLARPQCGGGDILTAKKYMSRSLCRCSQTCTAVGLLSNTVTYSGQSFLYEQVHSLCLLMYSQQTLQKIIGETYCEKIIRLLHI